MNLMGPLRAVALAGLFVSAVAVAAPAQAAPEDVALLQSYIGDWSGRGVFETQNPETVVCRLSLTQGNADKVNYRGRCAVAGTNLSINGTLAYINDHFEAAMTSNAKFSGVAVGRRQGNGVVFNLQEQGEDDQGNPMNLSATFTLANGAINVAFNVVDNETGATYRANVPFSR